MPGSKIVFFKNGRIQGEAFLNINAGAYYPAISIFKNATVSVNFGPNLKYTDVEEEYKCKGVRHQAISILELLLSDSFFSIADARPSRGADLRTIPSRYDVFLRE